MRPAYINTLVFSLSLQVLLSSPHANASPWLGSKQTAGLANRSGRGGAGRVRGGGRRRRPERCTAFVLAVSPGTARWRRRPADESPAAGARPLRSRCFALGCCGCCRGLLPQKPLPTAQNHAQTTINKRTEIPQQKYNPPVTEVLPLLLTTHGGRSAKRNFPSQRVHPSSSHQHLWPRSSALRSIGKLQGGGKKKSQ